VGLVTGFVLAFFGRSDLAAFTWAGFTIPVLTALVLEIVTSLRRGEVGLDIVAALSMTAAIAFGEELAAVVVALMYAGGHNLEDYAERRARREMTALLDRVPRTAMRYGPAGLAEVDLPSIVRGDRLLIRQGDTVPVDGVVFSGLAVLDQSALTGEALPVQLTANASAMSGSMNVGEAFDLVASRPASASTYAGIVRMVEAAQRSKAPMARLADRFALFFHAATVGPNWQSYPGGRGTGHRHALPADPGGTRRNRGRDVACGAARYPRQGRQGAGSARPRAHAGDRQDRDTD
jgi:cation transport ATPase